MTPDQAVLALIADLYRQVSALTQQLALAQEAHKDCPSSEPDGPSTTN